LSDCRFVYRPDSNLEVKIAQVIRNQRRQTHFSPQNSIFVDFFSAETQAVTGTTIQEQKIMEMMALRPDMTNPFNIASYVLLTVMVAQVCGLKPGL